MGLLQDIGRAIGAAANEGEDVTRHVLGQALGHPSVAAIRARDRHVTAPQSMRYVPPMPGAAYGPGRLAGLLGAALHAGKTIAGTQPYTVTSYFGLASASVITKNVDIADMFGSANCTAFTVNDTFPWPFQSYRMRWTYTSVLGILTTTSTGLAASVSDPAWIATLHAVFSNATEIARVALNNLGLRITLMGGQGFLGTTAAEVFANEMEDQDGVSWPVYYEKNGSYVMSVRTDHAVGTSFSPLQVSCQLDGWVINDPNLVGADESQIQATIDGLMRAGSNSVSIR